MRIKGRISLGSGQRSLAHIGHLYSLLSKALEVLGGIQQPPRQLAIDQVVALGQMGRLANTCDLMSNHIEEVREGEREVERIAAEIYEALTGKKIVDTPDVDGNALGH